MFGSSRNFSELRAGMRETPRQRFNENEAAPSYEALKNMLHHRGVIKLGDLLIARSGVFIHMLDESRFSEGKYDGDKLHLSVTPDRVPEAWDMLKGLLFSPQNPFYEFNVTDMRHPRIILGERIHAGAQFTLYITPSSGRHYSSQYLARIKDFIEACETRLQIRRMPHGIYPDSDVRGRTWFYTSYRNENRSEREGSAQQSQRLLNEAFFRLISE